MSDTNTATNADGAVKKPPKPGTFSSTHQPKHRRTADRIPHNVKADVVAGLAAIGEDGKGKGGFRGYVTFLGRTMPKQAARLIERLLPPSVVVANTGSSAHVHTVNIVSIPSGEFLSPDAIEKYRAPGLKLDYAPSSAEEILEHAPLQQLEQLEPLEHFEPIEQPASLTPQLTALEEKLLNMDHAQLMELAGALGVGR